MPKRVVPSTAIGGAPAQERTLRSQGKATMGRLLDAALEVFASRGYHAARVDDICKAAKASHGTFYLYFASKEDLFRALIIECSEKMVTLSESMPAIAPTAAGYQVLRDWLERFYDLYCFYHPVIRAWSESEAGNIDLGRMGAGVLRSFASTLIERVPPTVEDPTTAVLAMMAMVERSFFYATIQIVAVDKDKLLDTLAALLHVGLFGGTRRRKARPQ